MGGLDSVLLFLFLLILFFVFLVLVLVFLKKTFFSGAQAAIVVYDMTSVDTFNRAKTWIKELQRQANPNIVIALVANKLDLSGKRAVQEEV